MARVWRVLLCSSLFSRTHPLLRRVSGDREAAAAAHVLALDPQGQQSDTAPQCSQSRPYEISTSAESMYSPPSDEYSGSDWVWSQSSRSLDEPANMAPAISCFSPILAMPVDRPIAPIFHAPSEQDRLFHHLSMSLPLEKVPCSSFYASTAATRCLEKRVKGERSRVDHRRP